MPNLCNYSMRIKGNKKDVYEFYDRMTNYDKKYHLYRMFETYIEKEMENEDGTISIDVVGDCAWSIESCCRGGAFGYSGGVDLLSINSKDLHLEIECWSSESGMCFQEHYLYKNGDCLLSECTEWYELYYSGTDEESFEKFKTRNNLPKELTTSDLRDGCLYESGGFENYKEYQI